jgi:hypothetical protein
MSLSTKTVSVNRQEKTEELLKHHDWKFKLIQEENPLFSPKCAYVPKGMNEMHIGFFASEVKKARDIYVEFASIDLDPEDPDRTLYKWRFNPHFNEEYERTEPGTNGHFRYLVPVSELVKIEFEKEEPTQTIKPLNVKEVQSHPNYSKIITKIIDKVNVGVKARPGYTDFNLVAYSRNNKLPIETIKQIVDDNLYSSLVDVSKVYKISISDILDSVKFIDDRIDWGQLNITLDEIIETVVDEILPYIKK